MHEVALIGAGRIGRIHAANVARERRLRLRYVVDPVEAAAEAIAAESSAMVARVEDALADTDIAGVIIASATDTHLDLCLAAVDAGKAVFCEKPIDLDLARARAAANVLGAPDTRLLIGFNRRFDRNFRNLRDRLVAGELGALETLHIISHDPAPPPLDYVRVSGGLFRDMTIHDFDMARWLLGEEPAEIYACGVALVDPAIGEAGDIDTAKILLRTASGKLCMISNSRRSGYGYDQRIEAYCAGGLIRAGNAHSATVETWTETGPAQAPFQNFFLDRYEEAYRAEMSHFADILDGSAVPQVGYPDAVAALALAEAAQTSMKGRAIAAIG